MNGLEKNVHQISSGAFVFFLSSVVNSSVNPDHRMFGRGTFAAGKNLIVAEMPQSQPWSILFVDFSQGTMVALVISVLVGF